MIKIRYFSAHNDFKTCFLYKLFLLIGIILLIIFVFIKISSLFVNTNSEGFAKQIYDFSQTSYPNSIFAFSLIFLAVSIIFYFFYCQFVKLAEIVDEIEKEDDFDDSPKE